MDREALRRQLVKHEGLKLRLYQDSRGKWTIGCGRNLSDRGITLAEASILLEHDIDAHWSDLVAFYPGVTELDDVRQRVLLDLCFNLGITGLKAFRRMWAAIRKADWATAAVQLLDSTYATQVGARATRLAEMMRTGADPD
ncbi:MAG: glycoside hydrolase family protein [Gallionellaceae bacterium]|nr:glycoside hydrolase family protein [Gallionellaceae bacterium]